MDLSLSGRLDCSAFVNTRHPPHCSYGCAPAVGLVLRASPASVLRSHNMKCHGKPLSFASQSLFSISFLFLFLPSAVFSAEYLSVKGPARSVFPRDHGTHPGHRTEWWYYTGNVTGDSPKGSVSIDLFSNPNGPARRRTNMAIKSFSVAHQPVFLAHAALSDLEVRRFYHDEQMARGAVRPGRVEQQNDQPMFPGEVVSESRSP